jgi:uncharacterized membrane protein YhaH (DUF805 family)
MSWYLDVLRKYAVFTGRARRKEYWMFVLFNVIIMFALTFIESLIGSPGIIAMIYGLAVLVPSIAVTIRRFHDTDRSGWWILVSLIPFVGALILIVFMCLEGTPGDNRFGPSPKAGDPLARTVVA